MQGKGKIEEQTMICLPWEEEGEGEVEDIMKVDIFLNFDIYLKFDFFCQILYFPQII